MLSKFPEWSDRLMKAAHDGETLAIKSGSALDRESWPRRQEFIAAEMMKVVEQSNNVFGDYRNPKTQEPPIILGPLSKAK